MMDTQTPSRSQKIGRIKTQAVWNTRVRRKEMTAEINPLFRAVKKDEPKMLKPQNRKDTEYRMKAHLVIS